MKYPILLLWVCFFSNSVLSQNKSTEVRKGWLVYFGTEEICFPEDLRQSCLNFFDKKERLNGYNVKYTAYKACIYKEISKKYPVNMHYGNDTICVLPVTFEIELKQDEKGLLKIEQDSVISYRLEFNDEKYQVGYMPNNKVRVKKIKPYLKRDLLKAEKTECPFYEGP